MGAVWLLMTYQARNAWDQDQDQAYYLRGPQKKLRSTHTETSAAQLE
jgi:hypothetical protein